MRNGITNFIQNIIPALLFCPELKQVLLIDNGNRCKFSRSDSSQIGKNIFKTEFHIEE
jgi:hypothetical protein